MVYFENEDGVDREAFSISVMKANKLPAGLDCSLRQNEYEVRLDGSHCASISAHI